MTTNRMIELREVIEGYNARDAERVVKHYADDAEVWRAGMKEPIHGKAELRDRVETFLNAFPDFKVEIEAEAYDERKAAGIFRITGTQKSDLTLAPGTKIPASSKKVDYRFLVFDELNEQGKIVKETGMFDVLNLVTQLGARPETLTAGARR